MLTLQYVPYHEVEHLTTESKIKKLLRIVKDHKIVLMEGKLKPWEETALIQKTMEEVNRDFKGIELCTLNPATNNQFTRLFKRMLIKFFLGDKEGVTIIGPATIVKEIKRNPNKLELSMIPKRRR